MFIHRITPIPLPSYCFNCQPRFLYQIIKSINQSQRRQLNYSYNQRRNNGPNQFQHGPVVKTFRNWHAAVMEPGKNTRSHPQYQNQNGNQKETNIMMQIHNTFHRLSLRILKHHLPRSRLVCIPSNPKE